MAKAKLLDLFCGAGGCGMGYSRAGFEVVGIDRDPQPQYPFEFHQADALEYLAAHGHEFDFIHASPPCQRYSTMTPKHTKDNHPDLLPVVVEILRKFGKPYCIENVAGARKLLHAQVRQTEPVCAAVQSAQGGAWRRLGLYQGRRAGARQSTTFEAQAPGE